MIHSTEEFAKNFTNWSPNAEQLNKQLKLFTISVGTDDFLYEPVKQNIAMFQGKKTKGYAPYRSGRPYLDEL